QPFHHSSRQPTGRLHDGPHIRPNHLRGILGALSVEALPGVRRSWSEISPRRAQTVRQAKALPFLAAQIVSKGGEGLGLQGVTAGATPLYADIPAGAFHW